MNSLARRLACVLLALATGALAGCASSPYDEAREAWTRSETSYDVLDSQLELHATLKTEPFRRAYAKRYGTLYALTDAQMATLLASELEENARSLVIIAALWVPNPAWDDLNPSRGFWEVRLQGESGAYAKPFRVNRLKKRSPAYDALFPYIGHHHSLYELRFDRTTIEGSPLAASGQRLELIVAGAPAQIRMSWTMP